MDARIKSEHDNSVVAITAHLLQSWSGFAKQFLKLVSRSSILRQPINPNLFARLNVLNLHFLVFMGNPTIIEASVKILLNDENLT